VNYLQLSGDDFNVICQSLEQARSRIEAIEKGNFILPMKYSARLSWEVLYEVREIFRGRCVDEIEMQSPPFIRPSVTYSMQDLALLAQAINQVMAELQQIEMGQDMTMMKGSAQACIQMLDIGLFSSWKPRAKLVAVEP
jgi:hypothetical protein